MSELDKALRAYRKKFNKKYPLVITDSRTQDEILAEIYSLIENETEAETPEYEKDSDY